MEIDNAIFQDLESFGEEDFFNMAMEKFWCFVLEYNKTSYNGCSLGPVYTIPFSYEDGIEMFRFGLPSTLYRFPIRHQMKTVA